MKKTVVSAMLLAAALSVGTVSFAENGYIPEGNKVVLDDISCNVVLIYKGEDINSLSSEDIVYIDQADGESFGATEFLLKDNPDPGCYTIAINSNDGGKQTAQFYIGEDINTPVEGADKQTLAAVNVELTAEDKANLGLTENADVKTFVTNEGMSKDQMKTIIVKVGNKYLYKAVDENLFSRDGIEETSNFKFAIVILNAGENDVSVAISGKSVSALQGESEGNSEGESEGGAE